MHGGLASVVIWLQSVQVNANMVTVHGSQERPVKKRQQLQ